MKPELTKQDAAVVVLELIVMTASRLFDERFDGGDQIAPNDLKRLREARDIQLQRLRENLIYARRTTR